MTAEAKNVTHEMRPGPINGPHARDATATAQITNQPDARAGMRQTRHMLASTRTANSTRPAPGGPKNKPSPKLSGVTAANHAKQLVTVDPICRSRRTDPPTTWIMPPALDPPDSVRKAFAN